MKKNLLLKIGIGAYISGAVLCGFGAYKIANQDETLKRKNETKGIEYVIGGIFLTGLSLIPFSYNKKNYNKIE